MAREDEKIRISFWIENELIKRCDLCCDLFGFKSRNEFVNRAIENFIADQMTEKECGLITEKLAVAIEKSHKELYSRTSKGLFRYAVDLEMCMHILANASGLTREEVHDLRGIAIKDVRKVRGKIKLEDIARKAIKDYDPSLLQGCPRAIPIEDMIEKQYGLSIEYQYIRNNGRILGATVFEDDYVPIFVEEIGKYNLVKFKRGTIILDASLLCCQGDGRLRFTSPFSAVGAFTPLWKRDISSLLLTAYRLNQIDAHLKNLDYIGVFRIFRGQKSNWNSIDAKGLF